MKLKLFRHLWGVTEPWEEVFPRFQKAGYHGIEAALAAPKDRKRLVKLLSAHRFEYIPQIFTAGKTVREHVESFRQQVAAAKTLNPRLVNSHSGADSFTEEQSREFFEAALKIEDQEKISVAHETHRGRIFYNPWITSRLLAQFPELKLCCDFSHWACVCERLMDDQAEIIRQCAGRSLHLHARVGYEEGPQVPDPRAPEYQLHLQAHEKWWRMIWTSQKKRGFKVSTLTPEFGPPPYLHTLPFTQAPVTDLEAVCDWQAKRQSEQFAKFGA